MIDLVRSSPHSVIVTATKELVDELIARNTRNRRIRQSHLEYLIAEVRRGCFMLTNQGIGIDQYGIMIDGQHRLLALRAAGYPPVEIMIVSGLHPDVQKYIDLHAKRSMADTLTFFLNQTVHNVSVAALRIFKKVAAGWGASTASPDELIELYYLHTDAMSELFKLPKFHTLPAPVIAAVLTGMLVDADRSKCIDFMRHVLEGTMLPAGHPALTLRNWLNSAPKAGGGEMQRERYEKTRAALKAFLEDRPLQKLYALR